MTQFHLFSQDSVRFDEVSKNKSVIWRGVFAWGVFAWAFLRIAWVFLRISPRKPRQ